MNKEFKRMMKLAGLAEIKIMPENIDDSEYINDLMEFIQANSHRGVFPDNTAIPEFLFSSNEIIFAEDLYIEDYETKAPYTFKFIYSFEINNYPDSPYEGYEGDVSLKLISAVIETKDRTIDITDKFINEDLKPLEDIISDNRGNFWKEYIKYYKDY